MKGRSLICHELGRELGAGENDQNTLYISMKFSNNKNIISKHSANPKGHMKSYLLSNN